MTYLADQKTLYLLNPKMEIWATPTQIRWSVDGGKTEAHPREGVRDLVVHDAVRLDPSLLKWASREDKTIAVVDGRFEYLGWFVGPSRGKGNLRLMQYELCRDASKSLVAAKEIVVEKTSGQMALLREMEAHDGLSAISVIDVNSSESLLGIEGSFASAYFGRWPELLEGTDFAFDGRRRHPAPDPVNCLYDLCSSLLANEVYTFCCVVGLDPYVGFYHVTTANRPSLVADLMEPWRAPIVDKFILRALRRKEFSPDDFEMRDGACRLRGGNWGKAMAKWNDWYLKTERGRNFYRTLNFRDLVEARVREFVRRCMGDEAATAPDEPGPV